MDFYKVMSREDGSDIFRWSTYILAIMLFASIWLLFALFFFLSTIFAIAFLAVSLGIMAGFKIYKIYRLKRNINLLDGDPVNPARHYEVAKAWYFRGLMKRQNWHIGESMRAFRNAVQLDLALDIHNPSSTAEVLSAKYCRTPRERRFVQVMSLYATVDYLFEEYERRGLPIQEILVGRAKFQQFDQRQTRNIIGQYEYHLRELENFRSTAYLDPFFSDVFNGPGINEISMKMRKIDVLISFYQEMLSCLRRLYRLNSRW